MKKKTDDLERLRRQIDAIDDRILHRLASRRQLVSRILRAKSTREMSLRNVRREEELISRLIVLGKDRGLDAHFVTRVFHEIIDDALGFQERRLQRNLNDYHHGITRVAYQGIEGAYSQLAAQQFFSAELDRTELVGFPTFEEAVSAVRNGDADYAFLPIENTTAGSINQVYDLLSRESLFVVGEEIFRVDHCLLALEDVPLFKIRRVLSHPEALAQCNKFLSRLKNCRTEYYADTAMAVQKVKDDQDLSQAAIASEEAGTRYGLKVLHRQLADQPENFTRFFVVAPQPIKVDRRVPCKTSLLIATPHEEGALLKALDALHRHQINMTKLESRPRLGTPFQYLFYLDFEGNLAEENIRLAVDELRTRTTFIKVLGSYPMRERAKTAPPPSAYLSRSREAEDKTVSPEPATAETKVSYRLASRGTKARDTSVEVRGVRIGGPELVVIAGPCAVESREQIMVCARQVKEAGAHILRGGCFKPRTSPYSFQGLGFDGLALLAEAGRELDLPIITEVLAPDQVERVAECADILQVGARNMQNFSLLKAVGQVHRPVVLKRGMMATLEELLNAAEYILGQGNQQVILCERGIRTFETSTRNTLDLGAIPILRKLTHLPIVVDPSHAAGQRQLVPPLALAAQAVGAHGLMIEIHPNPDEALSDGPQSLPFPDFVRLMSDIHENVAVES